MPSDGSGSQKSSRRNADHATVHVAVVHNSRKHSGVIRLAPWLTRTGRGYNMGLRFMGLDSSNVLLRASARFTLSAYPSGEYRGCCTPIERGKIAHNSGNDFGLLCYAWNLRLCFR